MTARVDLRSDTVSQPSAAMRRAIADADVGDDRYGDDPTGRDAREWADLLAAEGVLVTVAAGRIRMVTHVGVNAGDVEAALGAWRRAASGRPAA
jgi:threonine aldolase